MLILKKLFFAVPLIIFFALACLKLPLLFKDPYLILSTDLNFLIQVITILVFLLLTSLSFAIFVTISSSWQIILPVAAVSSLIPLVILDQPFSLILTGGAFFSFVIIFLLLKKELDQYLTFKQVSLLSPSIKQLTTLLLLVISVSFYLVAEKEINQNGFKIPSSLIAMSLSLTQTGQSLDTTPAANLNQLQIPPQQLEYLKQNPQLLKQYGLDPAVLEELSKPQGKPQDTMAALVENQINNLIKPYQQFIPLVLTLLLFVTLKWIASILSLLLSPLVWFIFWVLEKTGFTKYQTEMREVKKLIV